MRRRPMTCAATLVGVVLAGCGGGASTSGGGSNPGAGPVLIALDVPSSTDPGVAGTITRGADLAARELNQAGGLNLGGTRRRRPR